MTLKILVTGDIHIGKRSSAVSESDPSFSARHTWDNIVSYAIDSDVDAVMLTGDIIERNNRFFEATAPLEAGLDTLVQSNIPVYMVAGNHDHDVLKSVINMEKRNNVHLLGIDGKWESKSFSKGEENIQVIGWSFPNEHYTLNPVDQLDQSLVDKSATTFILLHGDLLGNKSNYASLDPAQMKSMEGIDAWLLGHIHRPTIHNIDFPLILYPGSPQAFSPKEQGEHGPYILTIENKRISTKQIHLSPVQYISINIHFNQNVGESDIQPYIYKQLQDALSGIKTNSYLKTVVADIELSGVSQFTDQIARIKNEIEDFEGSYPFKVSIRKVSNAVIADVPVKELLNAPSYLGVLAKLIDDIENNRTSPLLTRITEEWKNKYTQAFLGSTYDALKENAEKEDIENYAKSFILEESRRLISTLYNQKAHAN